MSVMVHMRFADEHARTTRSHHLDRAPFRKTTSLARFFGLVHKANVLAKAIVFFNPDPAFMYVSVVSWAANHPLPNLT